MSTERSRPIDNIHDVRAVFDSGRASFREYMDCVEVSKDADNWQLRKQAAELATAEALGRRRTRPLDLLESAHQLVNAILSSATTIEELEPRVFEARRWFTERDNQFREKRHQDIDRLLSQVHDEGPTTENDSRSLHRLLLLTYATEAVYLVKLSSTLRRPFEQPNLAIDAATRALGQDPKNKAALTSRGAARVDMDDLAGAETDLDAALAIDGDSKYALVARSRCHLYCGEAAESLEVAQRALAIDPEDRFALHSVLSAAVALGAREIFDQVLQDLTNLSPEENTPDLWIQVLAIQAICDGGDLDRADAALRELRNQHRHGLPETTVRNLQREISNQQRRRQGRLDL